MALLHQATKLQAIEILRNIGNIDREHKYLLRPILQDCKKWFDDEVDPEVRERTKQDGHGELLPEKVKLFSPTYIEYLGLFS